MKLPKGSKIKIPAVIGAVIDLGMCLNLLDSENIKMLKLQYDVFKLKLDIAGLSIPMNKNVGSNTDLLLRNLDCAVIESLHSQRSEDNQRPFDSVRGIFTEGEAIYPSSGFKEKTHIQLCIRNPNCIKGYFAPKSSDSNWSVP